MKLRVNPTPGCDHGLRRLVVCTDHLYERYDTQSNPPNLQYLGVVVVVVLMASASPTFVTASLLSTCPVRAWRGLKWKALRGN